MITKPLTDLTRKDIVFKFGEQELASFNQLKQAFTQAPILQYPDQDREFRLETDASEFAVGAVLSVKGKKRTIPTCEFHVSLHDTTRMELSHP